MCQPRTASRFNLATLPIEILTNIVSFIIEVQCGTYHSSIRFQDLLNLSSTCRRFRTIISPLVWKNFRLIEEGNALKIIIGIQANFEPTMWTQSISPYEITM